MAVFARSKVFPRTYRIMIFRFSAKGDVGGEHARDSLELHRGRGAT